MNYTLMIMGILALSIGIFIWFWINKRQFNRRNVAGLEGFSSYEKSVIVRLLEKIGRWVAFLLILAGIVFLWGYSKQKKKMEQSAVIEEQLSNKT